MAIRWSPKSCFMWPSYYWRCQVRLIDMARATWYIQQEGMNPFWLIQVEVLTGDVRGAGTTVRGSSSCASDQPAIMWRGRLGNALGAVRKKLLCKRKKWAKSVKCLRVVSCMLSKGQAKLCLRNLLIKICLLALYIIILASSKVQ